MKIEKLNKDNIKEFIRDIDAAEEIELNINKLEYYAVKEDDIYLLRLVCLTGPIINSLNDITAQKVLNRINMINRGYQIQNVLVDLVSQSITNKNIFWKMNYKEQNDILDSLYQIGNNSSSPFSEKSKQLYNLIISKANNNTNV